MRPIDKTTARYHTDLSEERYHVDGRSKRLSKRFAKRKSSKAYRRALNKQPVPEDTWNSEFLRLEHDLRFVQRIEATRKSLREGRGVKLENVDWS